MLLALDAIWSTFNGHFVLVLKPLVENHYETF